MLTVGSGSSVGGRVGELGTDSVDGSVGLLPGTVGGVKSMGTGGVGDGTLGSSGDSVTVGGVAGGVGRGVGGTTVGRGVGGTTVGRGVGGTVGKAGAGGTMGGFPGKSSLSCS